MSVRVEVVPFLFVAVAAGVLLALVCKLFSVTTPKAVWAGVALTLVAGGYFLYFFRDPVRHPPSDPDAVLSGADGHIAGIVSLPHDTFAESVRKAGLEPAVSDAFGTGKVVRISIFLSLFDVHVNRAPISGESRFLAYVPGKHYFTFQEKSSDYNQHNSILIRNDRTVCLYNQIVGPVARRVVYWLDPDRPVPVRAGDKLGMMKFGSRLDMYFPEQDIEVNVRVGDFVRAGETIVARLKTPEPPPRAESSTP